MFPGIINVSVITRSSRGAASKGNKRKAVERRCFQMNVYISLFLSGERILREL